MDVDQDTTKAQQKLSCQECGTDILTKCWHQMSYEEWLVDVQRQNARRRETATAAAAQKPPTPPPDSQRLFLRPRSRRPRHQVPSTEVVKRRSLGVQMQRLQQKQKMMPALLEVPPPHQPAMWSDDEDDVNVIF